MLAIINDKEMFGDYRGEIFEIIKEHEDTGGHFRLESVFTGEEIDLRPDQVATNIEHEDYIVILEAPYSRHPNDWYLTVRLLYLPKKEEYVTRIYNKTTGGGNGGNYFMMSEFNKKESQREFNNAFVDYLNR